jgi:D-alanine-D-alanine ligase
MDRIRVLVLYNEPVLPIDHPDAVSERELLDNVEAISNELSLAGYDLSQLGVTSDPRALVDGIRQSCPDVVVNLFEGTADNNASELYAAGILEWLGVPYTGCPFSCLSLARSKHYAKRLFLADGLPTAPFMVVESAPVVECPLTFPVIVKPAQQDASVGVDQNSVVRDLDALNRRATFLLEQFNQPVLVEEFIFGRELTVALVEMPNLRLLPGTEVVFLRDDAWPILSYDAKWTRDSVEYNGTDYHFNTQLTGRAGDLIAESAKRAFRLMGCRDYARVDFRIRSGDDQPFILEVNPNPDFSPDRALANNLWAAGISHHEFCVQLVRNALARGQSRPSARYEQRQAS